MNSRSKAIFGSTATPLLNQEEMSNPVSTNQPAIPFSKIVKGQSMSTNPFLPRLNEKVEPTIERI